MFKIRIIAFVLTLSVVVSGCGPYAPVIELVRAGPTPAIDTESVDVSDQFLKYYKKGSPVDDVLKRLRSDGFTVSERVIPEGLRTSPTEKAYYGRITYWQGFRRYSCNYGLRMEHGKLTRIVGTLWDITFPTL